jgi:cytochrome c oxidase assembly protein subunit 15
MTDIEGNRRAIAYWLFVCCFMVFIMVVLGGMTRLTHSGLSIVEWKPLVGALPPLSEAQWLETFAKYQETPEYKQVNQGMDLAGFKGIFWLEYFHRLWGRLIGLVFLVPLLVFVFTKRVEKVLIPKLVLMFILGGLQGFIGWLMVKSGLSDMPRVSQYRLALHLSAAFLIHGFMFWVALDLINPRHVFADAEKTARLRAWAKRLFALASVTVVSGAFVAGIRAGLVHNTFPLMDGQLIPDGLLLLDPWYSNFFENLTTVQFDHRLLAEATFALVVVIWLMGKKIELPGRSRLALNLLLLMAVIQLSLGIATLLLQVPVGIATAHQGGAYLLFTLSLWLVHELRMTKN